MKIEIEFPDELPLGRRNSYLKGIADALLVAATSKSGLEHTPEGHAIYRDKGNDVAVQIIAAADRVTKH